MREASRSSGVASGRGSENGSAVRIVRNLRRSTSYVPSVLADPRPLLFHKTIPGYSETPLVRLGRREVEYARWAVFVKSEEVRLGLPSFKILGASWALHQEIVRRRGLPTGTIIPFSELRSVCAMMAPITLATATDGNHGRAVAAIAQQLGCSCRVYVPADMLPTRISAIRAHGADVIQVHGTYDDAVDRALADASKGWWPCTDVARGEVIQFPRDVQNGYLTIFDELFAQLGRVPELMLVQAGVGGLAAAATTAVRLRSPTALVCTVEPVGSNCVQESIRYGAPRTVADEYTAMAGLRCQSVSETAWITLRAGVDLAISIRDAWAEDAVRLLADEGLESAASGAAGVGAMMALVASGDLSRLALPPAATVALINTEGATDRPAAFED